MSQEVNIRKLIKYATVTLVSLFVVVGSYFGVYILHSNNITSFCDSFSNKPLTSFKEQLKDLHFVDIEEKAGHFIKLKKNDFWVRPHIYVYSTFVPLRIGCEVSHDGVYIVTSGSHQSAPWPYENPIEEHFVK
jgi:hypothetical protein